MEFRSRCLALTRMGYPVHEVTVTSQWLYLWQPKSHHFVIESEWTCVARNSLNCTYFSHTSVSVCVKRIWEAIQFFHKPFLRCSQIHTLTNTPCTDTHICSFAGMFKSRTSLRRFSMWVCWAAYLLIPLGVTNTESALEPPNDPHPLTRVLPKHLWRQIVIHHGAANRFVCYLLTTVWGVIQTPSYIYTQTHAWSQTPPIRDILTITHLG